MSREYSYDHIYVKHDCLFKSQREFIDHIEVSKTGDWGAREQHVNPDDIHIEWEGRYFYVSGVEKYGTVYLDLYGGEILNDLNDYCLVNTSEMYGDRNYDLHW